MPRLTEVQERLGLKAHITEANIMFFFRKSIDPARIMIENTLRLCVEAKVKYKICVSCFHGVWLHKHSQCSNQLAHTPIVIRAIAARTQTKNGHWGDEAILMRTPNITSC